MNAVEVERINALNHGLIEARTLTEAMGIDHRILL